MIHIVVKPREIAGIHFTPSLSLKKKGCEF